MEREIRTTARPLEVREDSQEGPTIVGYAAVFDQWSEDLGGFVERVMPGAFANALSARADVRALWNHDSNLVLGRVSAGTLRLVEDEIGLRYEITPPETQAGRDAVVSIRRGDVRESSFGFETVKDAWRQAPGGRVERDLIDVKLFDVSPVAFPAYPQATVAVRAKAEQVAGEGSGAGSGPDGGAEGDPRARIVTLRRRLDLVAIE